MGGDAILTERGGRFREGRKVDSVFDIMSRKQLVLAYK